MIRGIKTGHRAIEHEEPPHLVHWMSEPAAHRFIVTRYPLFSQPSKRLGGRGGSKETTIRFSSAQNQPTHPGLVSPIQSYSKGQTITVL